MTGPSRGIRFRGILGDALLRILEFGNLRRAALAWTAEGGCPYVIAGDRILSALQQAA